MADSYGREIHGHADEQPAQDVAVDQGTILDNFFVHKL